jgi:hypothetical protein
VWLVEGASFEPGAPLTPDVDAAVDRIADEIARAVEAEARGERQ